MLGTMVSIEAARLLLHDDFSPDAIYAFVQRTPFPLSSLREVRAELGTRSTGPLLPPLKPGELRPLVGRYGVTRNDQGLDALFATLLYAHSAAILDPLGEAIHGNNTPSEAEKQLALTALSQLAIVKLLIEDGIVVLVPKDLLPQVKLDTRRLEARLDGMRAQIFAILMGDLDSEPHLVPRISDYISDLAFAAQTGWSVHLPPIGRERLSALNQYARKRFLREARLRLWGYRMRSVRLRRFDAFALDTMTRVPIPDLSDLATRDVQLIRGEDAFGAWRTDLSAVVAEYERNLAASVRSAARIAAERLRRSASEIDHTITRSSALTALRAGVGTFAVTGSASLAAFPILSASGRSDAVGVTVG